MPFAVVEGQPITEMPRDLYIPPQALEVFLEAFEGPLDMLLYLIRRQNLDILDIPIAEITRQYMRYIELMQVLQLELAGEYLLMAATLAEVKSRMLLPRVGKRRRRRMRRIRAPSWCAACRNTSASSAPPRASIACRAWSAIPGSPRRSWSIAKSCASPPQVTLQEMLLAFQEVLSRSDMFAHHHVQREPLSVRQRMTDVLSALNGERVRGFRALVPRRRGPPRRHRHLRRHSGTAARGIDRNRAIRSLCARCTCASAIRPDT